MGRSSGLGTRLWGYRSKLHGGREHRGDGDPLCRRIQGSLGVLASVDGAVTSNVTLDMRTTMPSLGLISCTENDPCWKHRRHGNL